MSDNNLNKAKARDARVKGDRKQYRKETGKAYKRISNVKISRPKLDPRDY